MGPIETPTLSANRFVRDFFADSMLSYRHSYFFSHLSHRFLLYCSARDRKRDVKGWKQTIERIARVEVR